VTVVQRVAAAPISWGVCEVPGWGAVLPPSRVLAGMRDCGLRATELGPPGWLPTDPAALQAALGGLRLTAGFLAIPLHHGAAAATAAAARTIDTLSAAGAGHLVLAAASGEHGYDERPALDPAGWRRLVAAAAAVAIEAAARGLRTVLHPHVGTFVEAPEEIDAFLADTADIADTAHAVDTAGIADSAATAGTAGTAGGELGLCLDTGHVLVGGGDPVEVAARHHDRIHYVHLKDVDAALAGAVRGGRLSYADAVARGMYRPLGAGDVDLGKIVTGLELGGYRGWYVLEQDTALPTADETAAQTAEYAVRASLDHLSKIVTPSRSQR